jgi:hypothetical protein
MLIGLLPIHLSGMFGAWWLGLPGETRYTPAHRQGLAGRVEGVLSKGLEAIFILAASNIIDYDVHGADCFFQT